MFYTKRFIEEDSRHCIRGIQDTQRAIDAKVTSSRSFVVSWKCAFASPAFFDTLGNALNL